MKTGTLVKFKHPVDKDEAAERFTVVEDRGDRVLVKDALSKQKIAPTFVYLKVDLKPA